MPYEEIILFCEQNTRHNLVYAYGKDAAIRSKLAMSMYKRLLSNDEIDEISIYIYNNDFTDSFADVLFINEIQTLPAKGSNFENLLDIYISKQKRIFITSDRHPQALQNINAPLKNKIEALFLVADCVGLEGENI